MKKLFFIFILLCGIGGMFLFWQNRNAEIARTQKLEVSHQQEAKFRKECHAALSNMSVAKIRWGLKKALLSSAYQQLVSAGLSESEAVSKAIEAFNRSKVDDSDGPEGKELLEQQKQSEDELKILIAELTPPESLREVYNSVIGTYRTYGNLKEHTNKPIRNVSTWLETGDLLVSQLNRDIEELQLRLGKSEVR